MRWRILGLALVVGVGVKCSHRSVAPNPTPAKMGSPVLTQLEAEARAKIVSQVDYDLEFDLSSKAERYSGRAIIQFIVMAPGRDLRVDFADGEVTRVALNGKPLEITYNKRVIGIPGALLEKGAQRLEIEFNQEYNHQARGLVRFTDPVDKNMYVYTDFEPYDAHRAFPCFDQPDLKASYTVRAKVPRTWEVVSSVRESGIAPEGEFKVWNFPRSARFSTYIFSLHAGPYAKWEDKGFRIPLRLFARQSLAKYVKPSEWFPITRHGFDHLEPYFGYPYPYKKYDQIIVPEYGSGAMENVAAVTFSERFISRGAKTRHQIRGLANVILHEMSHMWFGDLVTMRWWGDLWLNETFATYMAAHALAAHPNFKESWQDFFAEKGWAYHEDQMITTHPVVGQVRDTNEAFTTFDGITYAKGAAVLKQLAYTIGEENFKQGLHLYFERFAEKNTEYRDFMNVMAQASNRNLDAWQRSWFETAGVNALSAQYECQDGKVSQLAILQSAPSGAAIMRPHALQVALLGRHNGVVRVEEVIRVEVSNPTTFVPAAIGKPCPHVVYLNYQDFGYLKARLDDKSVNALKYSLNEVEDPLLRQQLWHALWDKVRDAQFNLTAYADLLIPETLAREQDDLILRQINSTAGQILSYYYQSPKLRQEELPAFAERLDKQVWERWRKAKPGSNDQLIWLDALPNLISTAWGSAKLKGLLKGQEAVVGITLDQDRRWDLVQALARQNDPQALTLIEQESRRDPSSLGAEEKLGALAARPVWDEKLKWANEFKVEKPGYSFTQLRTAVRNLFPRNQVELRERFADQFFQDVLWVNQHKENYLAGLFADLAPWECSPQVAGRLNQFIASNQKTLQPIIAKDLKMTSQESERCRKIVSLAESGGRFTPPPQ